MLQIETINSKSIKDKLRSSQLQLTSFNFNQMNEYNRIIENLVLQNQLHYIKMSINMSFN